MPYVVNKEAFRGNRLLASKEKWRDRKLALTSRFRRLSLRLQHPNGLLGPMILKRLLCCAYLSVLALAFSHTSSAQNSLKLLPAPKEVKMAEGSFVVTSGTRIVIEANYADEDQNAAEILAQEVLISPD